MCEKDKTELYVRVVIDRRIQFLDYNIPKSAIPGLIKALQWYEQNKANIPLYDPCPDAE